MPQILHGSATEILKTLPKESVDVVYTCPSPFGYYNDESKIGGENYSMSYINNLIFLCNACHPILKPTGSLFIQLGDIFKKNGTLKSLPLIFEGLLKNYDHWFLNDRLIWHRTETRKLKNYEEKGFLKNYEFIFHFIKDPDKFYFNTKSKYSKTSVFSYPLEDSYYTNEFASGLPLELSRMIIDTSCPKNGTVLDPLAGSGTLGLVAKQMNRDYIMIDMDLQNCEMMRTRLKLN